MTLVMKWFIFFVAVGLIALFGSSYSKAESVDGDTSVIRTGVQLASINSRQAEPIPNRRQRTEGWCPQHDRMITREANKYPNSRRLRVIAHAFMYQESRCRASAVGPLTRHGRAYGGMQVLCSTAHSMGLRGSCKQLKTARVGIAYGVRYIANSMEQYGTSNIRVLATAYNAGPGYVGKQWIPGQTRRYISAVTRYQHMVPGGYNLFTGGTLSIPDERNVIDI